MRPSITAFAIKVIDTRCDLGATLDQNYQFNWATPKSCARSCKQLTMSLPTGFEGNALAAEFAFVR